MVHVDGAAEIGLVRLRLRDQNTQETVDPHDARVDAAGQHHEFRGVRPGRHTIVACDVDVDGAFVEIGSGADCESRIRVRPLTVRR